MATINFEVRGKKGRAVFARKGDVLALAVMLPNGYKYALQTDLKKLEQEAKALLMNRVGWDWDSVQRESKHIAAEAGADQLMTAAKCHADDFIDAEIIGAEGGGHHVRKGRHKLSPIDAKLFKVAHLVLYPGRADAYQGVQTGKLPYKVVNHNGYFYNARTGDWKISPIKGGLGSIASKLGTATKAATKAAVKLAKKAAPVAKMAAAQLGIPPAVTDKITRLVKKAAAGDKDARRKLARLKALAVNSPKAAGMFQVAAAVAKDTPAPAAPAPGASDGYYEDSDSGRPMRGYRPEAVLPAESPAQADQDEGREVDEDNTDDAAQPAADGGSPEGMDPMPATMHEDEEQEAEDADEPSGDDVGALELVGAEIAKKVSPQAMEAIKRHVHAARKGDPKAKAAIKTIVSQAKKGSPAAQAALHAVNYHVMRAKYDRNNGHAFERDDQERVSRFRRFFDILKGVREGRL